MDELDLPDQPFPLRWLSEVASERPSARDAAIELLGSLYGLAEAILPDLLVVMLSVYVGEYPVEITGPGSFVYESSVGIGGLLIPIESALDAYLSDQTVDGYPVEDPIGLLRWYLIFRWFQIMLPRLVFGEAGKRSKVIKVNKFAMAYADMGCAMLDGALDRMMAHVVAQQLTVRWPDDIPSPPWTFT